MAPPKGPQPDTRIKEAIKSVRSVVERMVDGPPRQIIDVVDGPMGAMTRIALTQREIRIIHYALDGTVDQFENG